MSVDAGPWVTFGPRWDAVAVLRALLGSRWRSRIAGGFWCVPPGEDVSEWTRFEHMGQAGLEALLEAKLGAREVFGVRLWWDAEDVGGEFLFFPVGQLMVSPTINRVNLTGRTSDVSWYLARTLPILSGLRGATLEAWKWVESC